MKKVNRLAQPESLRMHAVQWTKELLDEIDKKGSYAKADDSFKHKYRQADVRETLEKMYKKHCCYCESVVGTSSYGRIEMVTTAIPLALDGGLRQLKVVVCVILTAWEHGNQKTDTNICYSII